MAKNKKPTPTARLIEALQPEPPLAYDPLLYQAIAESDRRSWQKIVSLRDTIYRDLMPWFGPALAKATDKAAVRHRGNVEWSKRTGLPPMVSWENTEVVQAAVVATGYPATHAGIRAWALKLRDGTRKNSPKGKRRERQSRTAERDKRWLDEFERGDWANESEFAAQKRIGRSTMGKALKRAREARPRV